MFWKFLRGPQGHLRVPLSPGQADDVARTFAFSKTWVCACGAQLRIRAKEDRSTGVANFVKSRKGHATLPSTSLTWDGLAEERGWRTRPTVCPACQRGMSMADFKGQKRLHAQAQR